MIQLFHIPHHRINTAVFTNLLHDEVVRQFERAFADYVGAKYAVSFNSATSAIFLLFRRIHCIDGIKVPSIIPPVVPNALINAGHTVDFTDDVHWVGRAYTLFNAQDFTVIDSAQQCYQDQYKNMHRRDKDVMIFSFYPTKPVGSCDGGMIVSDDENLIEQLRQDSLNGMSFAQNNWERKQVGIGHKMYMNSIQATIALKNLEKLDSKNYHLEQIRQEYNESFDLDNTSHHLYRVEVYERPRFMAMAKEEGIMCGIHYEAAHHIPFYNQQKKKLSLSDYVSDMTVSIPFHEMLTPREVDKVIKFVKEYNNEYHNNSNN